MLNHNVAVPQHCRQGGVDGSRCGSCGGAGALSSLSTVQRPDHLVMAKTAEVHPFVTVFSIVLFGGLFGFLGILLAVPVALLIWTAVQTLWVERALDAGDDSIGQVVAE